MGMENIADINVIKAIVAACGGSLTLDQESFNLHLSMDLDQMELVFDKSESQTIMTLQYKNEKDNLF